MKAVYSLVVGLMLVSGAAKATSFPYVPQFNEIGFASFTGAGYRDEAFDNGRNMINAIRVRVPSRCALIVQNVRALDANGASYQVSSINALNDGMYSYFDYSVRAGIKTVPVVEQVVVGLNSAFYYTEAHDCGIRVYTK